MRGWPGRTTGAVMLLAVVGVAGNLLVDNDAIRWSFFLTVVVGAAVGAGIGASRAPRGRRLVPTLIAVGVALSALGDALWTALEVAGSDTDVSIADPIWFLGYAVLGAALCVVLGRGRRSTRLDVDFLIDLVTIVVVSVLIFWSLSIDTIIADQSVTPVVRAVWVAHPLADAVLLALVARTLVSRRSRAHLGTSFALGISLWLVADIAHLQHDGGDGALAIVMETGWLIGPVLMARAAWRVVTPQLADSSSSPMAWVGQILVAVVPLLVPPVLEVVAHLRGGHGQPVQLLVGSIALATLAFVRTGRLVRARERAHADLAAAHHAALEASRAKSMFLANMSHEIRTPLTTVLATGEMLEDTSLDSYQATLVGRMHRSGQLLKTLVEGILDFSRIEAGKLTLSSSTFDLHALATDAVDASRLRSANPGTSFECQLSPWLPHLVVGDPGRLLQILTNLLENASKFTDEGQVTLRVRGFTPHVVAPGGESEWVEFIVTDTGIGIRQQDQAAVFESFRQVDGSTTRRYGGNGLGLAICKELAEMMGGSITLQSAIGEGSSFTVRLPLPSAQARVPEMADSTELSFSG
ncbi:sensor histidine kinase [Nocardioides sp.]|uniref:sensor histidine kinase n=1 Tax=Nocardioides sp. TaxID=35761 RepID=UPI002B86E3F7|nr:ATP-binding protein [Nocardioides sp.]HXH80978.1 ATP-binding protein [Nocardioides sp.]